MDPTFVIPRYDEAGFAGLPSRIRELVASNRYDAVVLFLVDGFGWRFFEKFQSGPFLGRVLREGSAKRLTSQFPSTTSAHLTTIHTGQPVGQHGVYEWYIYEPGLEAVIAPLLYSVSGTPQRDTLKGADIKPARLYPGENLYRSMKKQGVSATMLQSRDYTPSTYSDAMFVGAKASGFRTLPEGLANLAEFLKDPQTPAYYFFYFDKVDTICHEYGPTSPQTEAEILAFLLAMENIFLQAQARNRKKVLFLLTADHGHVETDPETTIFINRDPAFAGIEKFLRTNRAGQPLVPAGSARDFFLHVKDEAVDEAQSFLSTRLEGRAEVHKVAELAKAGFFGPVLSPVFLSRVANLVILPYRGESVWWYEKDKFEMRFRGHHGGLTPQEMEIPLITWEMM